MAPQGAQQLERRARGAQGLGHAPRVMGHDLGCERKGAGAGRGSRGCNGWWQGQGVELAQAGDQLRAQLANVPLEGR